MQCDDTSPFTSLFQVGHGLAKRSASACGYRAYGVPFYPFPLLTRCMLRCQRCLQAHLVFVRAVRCSTWTAMRWFFRTIRCDALLLLQEHLERLSFESELRSG